MKKFIILIICFVLFLGACSDDNLEENSVSEPFLPSESNYSVSSESSVTENIESSSEPNIPISELTETNNIPGNSTFVKVEISACLKLNCYALTDSGNLYCFDYMDQSLECIRSGVIDFWEGSFYPEPNIIFENGWIFINEKYYYKPDFISVAGGDRTTFNF